MEWFYSYLTGKKQAVEINGHVSESCSITCGVLLDSILGSLLYSRHVNNMPISVFCQLLLYAEDSILIVSHNIPKENASKLGKELKSVTNG